jgi:hypothetical protein
MNSLSEVKSHISNLPYLIFRSRPTVIMPPNANTIEIVTKIDAPIQAVLAVLKDFPAYPSWSTYITALEPVDDPAAPPGTKLRVTLDGRVLNETVIQNDLGGLAWGGQVLGPRVFAAQISILAREDVGGGTAVTLGGEFKGVLAVGMRWMGMVESGRKGMEQFGGALKRRVESLETSNEVATS